MNENNANKSVVLFFSIVDISEFLVVFSVKLHINLKQYFILA